LQTISAKKIRKAIQSLTELDVASHKVSEVGKNVRHKSRVI